MTENTPIHDPVGIELSKPLSIWNKEINFDFKVIFKSILKFAVKCKAGNPSSIQHIIEMMFDGISTKRSYGETAYLLILKAIVNSAHDLTKTIVTRLDLPQFSDVENKIDHSDYGEFLDDFEHKKTSRIVLLNHIQRLV